MIRKLLKSPFVYKTLDFVLSPLTLAGSTWLRYCRFAGLAKMPFTKRILNKTGVFPLTDHYYEPLFRFDRLSLKNQERQLPIDWNEKEQLELISQFHFFEELDQLPIDPVVKDDLSYYFNNPSYSGYDAEFLYSFIRLKKPKKIIEIGSGFSTRMMKAAIEKNLSENSEFGTHITSIEPYEMPWLEKIGVKVIRQKTEEVELDLFDLLNAGDVLFIDSSHMIRPEGDVLYEMFQVIPRLKPGVFIHIHDIFSPFDYPADWLKKEYRMWNEQYILEALLMYNKSYKIIGALAYIGYKYPNLINNRFSYSVRQGWKNGSAMWLQKTTVL